MRFYESEEVITEELLEKLNNYYDDEHNPSEVSLHRQVIIEAGKAVAANNAEGL